MKKRNLNELKKNKFNKFLLLNKQIISALKGGIVDPEDENDEDNEDETDYCQESNNCKRTPNNHTRGCLSWNVAC